MNQVPFRYNTDAIESTAIGDGSLVINIWSSHRNLIMLYLMLIRWDPIRLGRYQDNWFELTYYSGTYFDLWLKICFVSMSNMPLIFSSWASARGSSRNCFYWGSLSHLKLFLFLQISLAYFNSIEQRGTLFLIFAFYCLILLSIA